MQQHLAVYDDRNDRTRREFGAGQGIGTNGVRSWPYYERNTFS